MRTKNTSSLRRQLNRGRLRILKSEFVQEDTGKNVRYLERKTNRGRWIYVGKF